MNTHISHLLNAYLDHELAPEQVLRVEKHLRECAACRKELHELQALSSLLAQTRLEATLSAAQRISRNVEHQISVTPRSNWQYLLRIAWKLLPFSLAGMWGVIQAIFLVVLLVQFALQSGLFADITSLLPPADTPLWIKATQMQGASDLEQIGEFVLQTVSFNFPFLQGSLIYLLLQFGMAVLFAAWLAGWWISKSRVFSTLQAIYPGLPGER